MCPLATTSPQLSLASWNCYRGRADEKASLLSQWNPDVVLLQECSRPAEASPSRAWSGWRDIQGFGVVAQNGWTVREQVVRRKPPRSGRAFILERAGLELRVLQIWAQIEPSYQASVMSALDHFARFIRGGPCFVAGDFNFVPRLDTGRSRLSSAHVFDRLEQEFDLVSAYHSFHRIDRGSETHSTLFWLRKPEHGFHCDLVFVPQALAGAITGVTIPDYETLKTASDHRPVIVELNLDLPEAMS